MKIVKAGVLNEDFLNFYGKLSYSDVNLGDINAMLAALRVAEKVSLV